MIIGTGIVDSQGARHALILPRDGEMSRIKI